MGKDKDRKETCAQTSDDFRTMRLKKWSKIYDKAQDVILEHLGKKFAQMQVSAACQAIQTASREIQVIERVLITLGELKAGTALGYSVTPHDDEIEALFIASMQRQKENEINA